MKILSVTAQFAPAWGYGGPVRVAYDQARLLAARGHDVTVVTTDTLDGGRRVGIPEETMDGFRVLRFRNVNNRIAKTHNAALPLGFVPWARKHVREFDVAHLHDFYTLMNVSAAWAARKAGVPYVVQPHGSANFLPERKKTAVKRAFYKVFGESMVGGAGKIVCLSPEENRTLPEPWNDGRKTAVIRNGIDFSEPGATPEAVAAFREKFGLTGRKILLSLGRLNFVKRFDLLISYAKDFLAARPEWAAVVAGPDEGERAKLEKLAADLGLADRVVFTGGLYGEEKAAALGAADVFALASDSEGGGMTMVALEALRAGLPMLLSEGCRFSESHPKIAVFGNAADFSGSLGKLAAMPKGYEGPFVRRFDVKANIDLLENIYAQLAR